MNGGSSRSLCYRCLISSYQKVDVNRTEAESASRINLRANGQKFMNALAAVRCASFVLKIPKCLYEIDKNVTFYNQF